MKRAEDIVNEISEFGMANQSFWYVSTNKCLEGIKATQIDAIEATVKRCAERAEIKDVKVNYTGAHSGGYYITKEINKQSILQVAEQLISKL